MMILIVDKWRLSVERLKASKGSKMSKEYKE
jgi:hypothetical protein